MGTTRGMGRLRTEGALAALLVALSLLQVACGPTKTKAGTDKAGALADALSDVKGGLPDGSATDVQPDAQLSDGVGCEIDAGVDGCVCSEDLHCQVFDDADACNGTLYCDAQTQRCLINPATVVECGAEGAPCMPLKCNAESGDCEATAAADGAPCQDGDPCTEDDACLGGACSGGQDTCACHVNADCVPYDDGDLCNGLQYCDQTTLPWSCKFNPASIVNCMKSKDPCSTLACLPATGTCTAAPVADGTACEADGAACTPDDSCQGGICVVDSAGSCGCSGQADCAAFDDQNACNGTLFCDLAEGKCKVNPVTIIACAASQTPCLHNVCDPKTGACKETPDTAGDACDDGNHCTVGESCAAGGCGGGQNNCQCSKDGDCAGFEDGDLCNGTLYCDKVSGGCVINPATVVQCDPGELACEVNACVPATGKCALSPQADGEPCDDGFGCTKDDTCDLGKCKGGPNVCPCGGADGCVPFDDGDPCNGSLFCDKTQVPASCVVNPATVPICAANDEPCNPNGCDPKNGTCATIPAKPGQACDDGNPCTKTDLCDGKGACASGGNACVCTTDADCVGHEDGNPCTGSLFCDKSGAEHVCATNKATVIHCAKGADSPCRLNQCQPADGKCKMTDVPEGLTCEQDGEACTLDLCAKGTCISGPNVCGCLADLDCKAFEDGNLCNGTLRCQGDGANKVCVVATATVVQCTGGGFCGDPACNPLTGQCKITSENEGLKCDDGDACTATDTCLEGVCVGKVGVAALDCDDQDPCTVDTCKVDKGCVNTPDTAICDDGDPCTQDSCAKGGCDHVATGDGGACDDGDACTSEEVCTGGSCVGAAVKCPGDGCKKGTCDAVQGCVWQELECDDGDPCSKDGCDQGACTHLPLSGEACGGDSPCAAPGLCLAGKCLLQVAPCDDDNPCTTDSCAQGKDCQHTPVADGALCDDASGCTTGDHCQAGLCKGAYVANWAEVMAKCDDANPCTQAACDLVAGCVHVPVAGACSDGDKCTGGDHCADGLCEVEELPPEQYCDDANPCTNDGCAPLTGCVYTPSAATCTDGDACTLADHCEGSACVGKAMPAGACDDGKSCTEDVCLTVFGCTSTLKADCDDGQACTLDGCDEAAGAKCVHLPRFGFCDDGSACTKADTCAGGVCVAGPTVSCDDDNSCTGDSCAAKTGCAHLALEVTCTDDDACTEQDSCVAGQCVALPLQVSVACDDANPCTDDACSAKAGCTHAAMAGPCDDGDACTDKDSCKAGACAPGEVTDCDDGDPCTTDGCAKDTGCAHPALPTNAPCGATKICIAGKCAPPCPAGNEGKDCADLDACTWLSTCQGGACKVATDGRVSTLAGGQKGDQDGLGTAAQFSQLRGLIVDGAGHLLVADTYNHRIRKVSAAGVVSAVAGTGKAGAADGPAATATFKTPSALARDGKGHLYIADTGNNRIRRLSAAGVVDTLAGSLAGFADGVDARFHTPEGLALGPDGLLYVGDGGNQRVRRMAPGVGAKVSTFAGSGVQGYLDGVGSAARFQWPAGLAFGPGGQLYVADTYNHRVRVISPGGAVSTLAGSGLQGHSDGALDKASFDLPGAVTVDLAGVVFVADLGGHRIRQVSGDKVVTLAGGAAGSKDGAALTATFNQPRGLAGGGDGRLYIADSGNFRVRVLQVAPRTCADGDACTLDGCDADKGCLFTALDGEQAACEDGDLCTSGDHCGAGACVAGGPTSCDDGNVCTDDSCTALLGCAHQANQAPCSDDDACTTGDTCAASTCLSGAAKDCSDGTPCTDDVCASKDAGCSHTPNAAACDDGSACTTADACTAGVCGVAPAQVTTRAGSGQVGWQDGGWAQARFSSPAAVTSGANGDVLVADLGNHRLRRIPAQGFVSTLAGDGQAGAVDGAAAKARFNSPTDLDWHSGSGTLYVADMGNHRIRQVAAGAVSTLSGAAGKGFANGPVALARFDSPRGLATTLQGAVLVADQANHRVRRIAGGWVSTLAGDGKAGFADGPAASARFQLPTAVATAPSGRVWVADGHNNRLRRIGLDGVVTTVAGDGSKGFADGPATKAKLSAPSGLAVDGAGRVWFADTGNHRLRLLTDDGQVLSLAGAGLGAFADGPGAMAAFDSPVGIALTGNGKLVIADFGNHRIRALTLALKDCGDSEPCTLDVCTAPDGVCSGAPIPCDDASPCTADACKKGLGCVHEQAAGPCNDGDPCTSTDVCNGGTCQGVKADATVLCDDKNPCTDDGCTAKLGCVHLANAATCTDADACTSGDGCQEGACLGKKIDVAKVCDDGDVCTDQTCHKTAGCKNPLTAQCDDGNPCTDTGCDKVKGCFATANSAPCQDGDACSEGDVCVGGACAAGKAKVCDDGTVCTDDSCDKAKGCQHAPVADGSVTCDDDDACTKSDACAGGKCAGKAMDPKTDCDDKDVCTDDSCDKAKGCVHKQAAKCDDGNGCTDDSCDAAKGCQNVNNAAQCEDGDKCTILDQCAGGVCKTGAPRTCSDGNVCTDDSCDKTKGCLYQANSGKCDDGDACTKSDACAAGQCKGVAVDAKVDCDDADACTQDGCDPLSGGCVHADISTTCDDGQGCTTDSCAKAKGCLHVAKKDGVPCSDGDACTVGDACVVGKCAAGIKQDCDDGNACTDDLCGKLQGCSHSGKTGACDDGDACTESACMGGLCKVSKTKDCDDGKACTQDLCDAKTADCSHNKLADGAKCGPGATCLGKQCVSSCAGKADGTVCDDLDGCTWGTLCESGACKTLAAGSVSTRAGSGAAGYADGGGGVAKLKTPWGLFVGPDGVAWIADRGNHRLRKTAVDGMTSTVAGTGSCGSTDGKGDQAAFCSPAAVVGAGDGSLLVADSNNHRLRKVSAAGTVSTFAGSSLGDVDGAGAVARFRYPEGLTMGADDSVWVADQYRLRKVSKDAQVTTIAGSSAGFVDGKGAAARFRRLSGLAFDTKGDLFVADRDNHAIRRVSADGVTITVTGGKSGNVDGPAASARFYRPVDVAFNAGMLVISDYSNQRIRALLPSGVVVTLAGSAAGFADGPPDQAKFSYPAGIANVAPGALLVGDANNHRLRLLQLAQRPCDDADTCTADACNPASGACVYSQLDNGASCDDGQLCTEKDSCSKGTCKGVNTVCDDSNPCTDDVCAPVDGKCVFSNNIKGCDDGDPCTPFDACSLGKCVSDVPFVVRVTGGGAGHVDGDKNTARLSTASDLAMDAKGNVLLAQYATRQAVRRISPDGAVKTIYDAGTGSKWVRGVAAGPDGSVYVTLTYEYRIRRIGPLGDMSFFSGSGVKGSADGPAGAASFGFLSRLAHDGKDKLYVLENSNHRLRIVATDGGVSTLAGGTYGFADGKGGAARFYSPSGMALDGKGNVFVADTNNNRIRKVAADGTVSTVAGVAAAGFVEGPAKTARFNKPQAVAVNSKGEVFVADTGNKRIRRIGLDGSVITVIGGTTGGPTTGPGTALEINAATLLADDADRLFFYDALSHQLLRAELPTKTCSDGNSCTDDSCDGQTGKCLHKASGDGLSCGPTLVCAGGSCGSVCQGKPDASPCDDGDACSTGDACQGGLCTKELTNCDDGLACTQDVCKPDDGKCQNAPLLNGTPCDDGSACTDPTVCASGKCVPGAGTAALFAGKGYGGFADGVGPAAKFSGLTDAEAAPDGFLYLADSGNNRIRRVDAGAKVTTFAGKGTAALLDGERLKAAFNAPRGISMDDAGVLWVADSGNHAIRRIGKDDKVSVLAGNGAPGYKDGKGAAAAFSGPGGIDAMADGSAIFVADASNYRLRQVLPDGTVSTIAGAGLQGFLDGPAAQAKIGYVHDLTCDLSGRLYFGDATNKRLRRLANGMVTTVAGDGNHGATDGPALKARFTNLLGVDWHPSGEVYIADGQVERIRVVSADLIVRTLVGHMDDLSGVGVDKRGVAWGVSWGKLPRVWRLQPAAWTCGDNDPCTADGCDPETGQCTTQTLADGTVCGPGSACKAGKCVPACAGQPDGSPCDDADPCTSGEQCKAGVCAPGKAKDCDDGNDCTADSCHPLSGKCANEAQPNFRRCDDGKLCTGNDACLDGACVAAAGPVMITAVGDGTSGQNNGPMAEARVAGPGQLQLLNGELLFADGYRLRKVSSAGVVSTYAGGSYGHIDGPVASARFRGVGQIAVGPSGNVWLVDTPSHVVRAIADGQVSTFAGSGSSGYQDGKVAVARFKAPRGLARDAVGNLYVADTDNHCIRKINTAGQVRTLAGSCGVSGSANGVGSSAYFKRPWSLAAEGNGNVYACEFDNHRVRKITPSGATTTLAGSSWGFADGNGSSAKFAQPGAMNWGADGALLVADRQNNRVRRITTSGVVTTVAGSSWGMADGPIASARLRYPAGVAALPSGEIWISDPSNYRLRKLLPAVHACGDDNACTTDSCDGKTDKCGHNAANNGGACGLASTCQQGQCVSACAGKSDGAPCLDGDGCTVADACSAGACSPGKGNDCDDGSPCTWGTCDPSTGKCQQQQEALVIPCDDGKACTSNDVCAKGVCTAPSAAQVVTIAGGDASGFADGPAESAKLHASRGLLVDGKGRVIFADSANHRVRVLGTDGLMATMAGAGTAGAADGPAAKATFHGPYDVEEDGKGGLFIVDRLNSCIRQLDNLGVVSTVAGGCGSNGNTDGAAALARFYLPRGAALDATGRLWVADTNNHRVRRVELDGSVVTVAGSSHGFSNGLGAVARFGYPADIAIDGNGDALVADRDNHRIRRVSASGLVVTLVGGSGGSADGDLSVATLNSPNGVAIDKHGRIYVGEMYRIRAIFDGKVKMVAGPYSGWRDGVWNNIKSGLILGVAPDGAGGVVFTDSYGTRLRKLMPVQPDCDDLDSCTVDSCDDSKGCQHVVAKDGAGCDDGNPCTETDICAVGKCAGKAVDAKAKCDDKLACTDDSCDPKAGCVHSHNGGKCADGSDCSDLLCASATCNDMYFEQDLAFAHDHGGKAWLVAVCKQKGGMGSGIPPTLAWQDACSADSGIFDLADASNLQRNNFVTALAKAINEQKGLTTAKGPYATLVAGTTFQTALTVKGCNCGQSWVKSHGGSGAPRMVRLSFAQHADCGEVGSNKHLGPVYGSNVTSVIWPGYTYNDVLAAAELPYYNGDCSACANKTLAMQAPADKPHGALNVCKRGPDPKLVDFVACAKVK